MIKYCAYIGGLLGSWVALIASPAGAQALPIADPFPIPRMELVPYSVKDLGQVSETAPIGCLGSNGQFFGTRNNAVTGWVNRPFTPGSQGTDFDLYYFFGFSSWINGCNGNGEAVGFSVGASVWDVQWSSLQALPGGNAALVGIAGEALAINASRQVVGFLVSDLGGRPLSSATLWVTSTQPNDTAVTVTTLARNAVARAINDAGEIVGECYGGIGTDPHACDFSAGAHARRNFPLSSSSAAWDINASGKVTGYRDTTAGRRGFHWLPATGELVDLPPITTFQAQRYRNAQALALNDDGVTVGASWDDNGSHRATIWLGDGTSRDLNGGISAPGLVLTEARDINANGVVLCDAMKDGRRHAVLLTPTGRRWYWL